MIELINATVFQNGNILDVGCGWGRFFQMYIDKGLTVSAVDISIAMIQAAIEEWRDHPESAVLKRERLSNYRSIQECSTT